MKFLKNEQGATLVEELITIAIIGFGIVILIAMITTGVIGVRQVDDKVQAETLARSQLELIKDAAYQADPEISPYPSVAPITNYVVSIAIEYWDAANGTFIPTVWNDGLQKITVTVISDGETLVQTADFKVNR
ncbi:MAG: type II secretion system protein [Anaerolineales bacterium]